MARPTSEYNRKRNFNITSEPPEETSHKKSPGHALRFVIQKHDARRLHYDFRLELAGTLKSWAIPKGPSLDPKDKRLAVHVEDHPLSYAEFEGSIPQGQYGGGDVIVWDEGVWKPHGDALAGYKSGKLKFTLIGEKLTGNWTLVKTRLRGSGDKEQWLLIKENDEVARPSNEYDIVQDRPESVITGDLLPLDKNASTSKHAQTNNTKSKKITSTKSTSLTAKTSNVITKIKSAVTRILKKPKTEKITNEKAKKVVATNIKKNDAIPKNFTPELATLVSEPPDGDWLYEIKFDGYRILTRILKGEVKFFTRNGNDWTERLPLQVKAIEALNLKDSWLDGEIVVLNGKGLPNFQSLQNAFDRGHSQDIIYYLFDAPFLNNSDMREFPLEERRAALQKIISRQDSNLLRFSEAFGTDVKNIIESACSMSLEGVIGKRACSIYVSKRSADWIKLKCRLRQEFVIIGYTDPQGSRAGFGAILLGVHQGIGKSEIVYAGRVGTGFNESRLHDIYKKMKVLECDTSPLSKKLTSAQARAVHWVKPKLVCEVEFAEWTDDGVLRQAAFISLRTDKPAKNIIREHPIALKKSTGEQPKTKNQYKTSTKNIGTVTTNKKRIDVSGISISHPERILDTNSGNTKLDLVQFYNSISDVILPHIAHRPVSLLRAPNGIAGEQFFQKHSDNKSIPHITQLDTALDPGHAPLMEINNSQALLGCVQMNTIELHTWGATSTHIETPDRFILDLDPDPALPWRSVIEATHLTLAVLDELKLNAFIKTTGGKGMHILVPLTPDADWESVKEFSKTISQFMAEQIPERFVAKMGPNNRVGKIFIDYLRNTRGASTVSAYSVRARAGLPVSVPLSRDELDKIQHPNFWTITNLHERLDKLKTNPWRDYTGSDYKKTQKISKAMWKKLGR